MDIVTWAHKLSSESGYSVSACIVALNMTNGNYLKAYEYMNAQSRHE